MRPPNHRALLARLAGALAVGVAVGAAVFPLLSVDADVASCSVTASSYADSIVNPPRGEDTEFFVNTGGIPSLVFLVDNSTSMLRLPPDGAALSWGTFASAKGNGSELTAYGCTNAHANALVFHSACGATTGEGLPYNPPLDALDAPPVWAEAKDANGSYCPYMTSGLQAPRSDKPGWDPDFYPSLFPADRVFHDTSSLGSTAADGWTDAASRPAKAAASGAELTVATFCDEYAADPLKEASCDACMKTRGYFFDGTYRTDYQGPSCASTAADCAPYGLGTCVRDNQPYEYDGPKDNQAHCRVPNVWLTGNFLNFHPPKFVIARKVLKDVLQEVRKIRLGLVALNGDQGAKLLDDVKPQCNLLGAPSSFDAMRSALLSRIDNFNAATAALRFDNNGAPLAEALLDVGQLFASRSRPWFSSTFSDNAFQEPANKNSRASCVSCQASAVLLLTDGKPTHDGVIPGTGFASPAMSKTIADAETSYAGMPGYNITGIPSSDCAVCDTAAEASDPTIDPGFCIGHQLSGACDGASTAIKSYLPKVAWYLRNLDLQDNAVEGSDGFLMTGKQTLTTYTIGLGAKDNAARVLQHTAEAGGGLYNGGSGYDVTDAKTLKDAILRVIEDVTTRSTSFGAASLSTLQASATQGVLVPRFEPNRTAHWNGHLYAFDLYSEFTGNSPACVIPASGASGPDNGDYDCDGRCTSVFLKDADGDFVQEDGAGAFKKNNPKNRAACGYGSTCSKAAGECGDASNLDAVARWDAGDKLSPITVTTAADGTKTTSSKTTGYKRWNDRKIYTVTDSDGDGKFTSKDAVIQVVPSSAASTLAPYLNIGAGFCADLAKRLTDAGNTDGAIIRTQLTTGLLTKCAEVVLQFVVGADVFKTRTCTDASGGLCTRPYQLGDVFHSSPVEVWPPLASDGYLCPRGLHPQCIPSLFSKSIPNPSTKTTRPNANAYDDYAKLVDYRHRKKFSLVGANDGMLHAFVTGVWVNEDDPRTTPKENQYPHDGFHDDRSSTVAEIGTEMWAFIPPDLLPKLRLLLEGTHHFFVDGTSMVRDVWIDGGVTTATGSAANKYGGTVSADGKRQGGEFYTVAVVGERRGGTHYFALDVTDSTDDSGMDGKPRFLWLYPQPNDPEELAFGETYVEFVPKPPPIGPVRIEKTCATGDPTFVASSGTSVCFEERWIVFLSGGYDPQYTKGRGVHMVDIASGDEVWDFSQPPGNPSTCGDDPRCFLNYPVAASVGMMMWGNQANFLSAAAQDGYFDTATFGDTGGQLWVLRFRDPGKLDSNSKVTNWVGARIFQHSKASAASCGLNYCASQPFFYITSNLPLQANGLYRVLAGTGDRFNLLDPVGGVCSPDNIRACIMKGCTVKLDDGAGGPGAVYGVNSLLGTQTYHMNHAASCSTVDGAGYGFARTDSSGSTCTTVTTKIDNLLIECPATKTCSTSQEWTRKKAAVACSGGTCVPAGGNEFGHYIDLKGNLDRKNWFFSLLVFEKDGTTERDRRIFNDLAGAKRYDEARLSEDTTELADLNAWDNGTTGATLATPESKGWKYYFDHGDPNPSNETTMRGTTYHIYRTDERVASVSAVEASCTFWNTMQTGVPIGAYETATTDCPVNSPCKASRSQISYLYGASPSTGGLCLHINGSPTRVQKNETLVPPHIGKLVAYVSSGQVSFGLTSVRIPQGGSNVALGEVQDIQSVVEWLPVDHATHACRHSRKDQPAPECK